MILHKLKDKKILIIGYGVEGKATHRFLRSHFPESVIGTTDRKDGSDYLGKQKDFDIAIRSPGVPKELITIAYTTATNIFFESVRGITIGVTGTKGKSTTSSLIAAIVRESGGRVHLIGNIGTPLLDGIMNKQGVDDYYVCELSSYQLDDIGYSPHISVILNLFPEHMDYHQSVTKYMNAKMQIVAHAKPTDFYVYNPQFPQLVHLAKITKARSLPFIETLPFPDGEIKLRGEHNKDNVRAAVTVAEILKIHPKVMRNAVSRFRPLTHRLEFVGTHKGINFYDDAISTTPQSTLCAIKSLPRIGTIFLGGLNRGYDFGALARAVVDAKIRNIVLFPDSGSVIEQLLKESGAVHMRILSTRDMAEAVRFAYQHTPAGYTCLLSTASPSYGVWKNFEEKGDLFKKFVVQYGKEN